MYKLKRRSPKAPSPAPNPIFSETIRILPNLLWFSLAVIIFWVSYKPLLNQVSRDGISKMSFAAFQVEFAKAEFDKAAEAYSGAGNRARVKVIAFDVDRIKRLSGILPGTRALWVADENPTEDFAARRAFASIGISFDLARSTNEAQDLFDLADKWRSPYDLIISDFNRSKSVDPGVARCFPKFGGSPTEAGCKLLQVVQGRYPEHAPPVIFYSSDAPMGTPPGALGATDRFDELARLVLDAVERRQSSYSGSDLERGHKR